MDRKESWSQLLGLLLQTVVPLVVAGGATGILTAFKEHLPHLLYSIFLYVIWGVVIVMLSWLVLRLILGDLPAKSISWIKNRRRNQAERNLAKEWCDKWLELAALINEVIELPDEQIAENLEKNYNDLRIWFRNNRAKLLPLWHYFHRIRTRPAHEGDYSSTTTFKYEVFFTNDDDPFSYFYEPLIIGHLRIILKKRDNDNIRYVLSKLSDISGEFVQWVSSK
jgi:hypothetical protein